MTEAKSDCEKVRGITLLREVIFMGEMCKLRQKGRDKNEIF